MSKAEQAMTDDALPSGPGRHPRRPGGTGAARVRALGRTLLGWLTVDRPDPEWRTVGRALLAVLAVLVPSAVWGVATASADGSLGPHLARYEVTLDHAVTVDVGPLGTLVIDSPLPLTLGARVVVQEIPREVTAVGAADTLSALGADLQSYVQFFTAPEATLDVAVQALLLDALRRALLAATLITLTTVAVRAALGPARRAELWTRVRPWRALIGAGTALVLLVTTTVTASTPLSAARTDARPASAVFDGTPLEGAMITGRLAGVIDTYGRYVVDAYRTNDEFYDGAVAAVEVAWDERAAADAELQALRDSLVLGPRGPGMPPAGATQDGSGDAGSADDASADDVATGSGSAGDPDDAAEQDQAEDATGDAEAAPSDGQDEGASEGSSQAAGEDPSATPSPTAPSAPATERPSDSIVAVVVSDLHCNVGMARVIRAVAERAGADLVLNAGDTTVNGTAVESYCVNAFSQAVPAGAELVVADGNHDSEETSAQERRTGARVLDGEVIEVAGLRILGDSDPNATRVGVGTVPVGEESLVDAGRRLAEVACADEAGVDLLLVHNPNLGNATLDQGCAPAQVSGHQHRRTGPVAYRHGIRYVSSSTAGAALNQVTVGPLRGVAELTVLRFDPETGAVTDHRLIRVHPDGSATVGLALRWPDGLTPQRQVSDPH